jgi:hypothetical protein
MSCNIKIAWPDTPGRWLLLIGGVLLITDAAVKFIEKQQDKLPPGEPVGSSWLADQKLT